MQLSDFLYYAGLTVWNSLPDELRNSDGFDSFKRFIGINVCFTYLLRGSFTSVFHLLVLVISSVELRRN